MSDAVKTDEREQPWEANCDFMVRGANADEVGEKLRKLNAAAKRLGIGQAHTDYEGPQDEATRNAESPAP